MEPTQLLAVFIATYFIAHPVNGLCCISDTEWGRKTVYWHQAYGWLVMEYQARLLVASAATLTAYLWTF